MGLLRKIIKQVKDLNESFDDTSLHLLYKNLQLYYGPINNQAEPQAKPVACGLKMYGWYDKKRKEVSMIYGSEKLVKMCSPDGFDYKTKNGEGFIADLEITVIKPLV